MALSDGEVTERLRGLDGWAGDAGGIGRNFAFPGFGEAIAFVGRVATLAEGMDHHPDIDIRFDHVRIHLVTHDAGGVTDRDVELARRIQAVASSVAP